MDNKRLIPSDDWWWPDMDYNRTCIDDCRLIISGRSLEMHLRWWISTERSQSTFFLLIKILRFCDIRPFSRSLLWLQTLKLQLSADMQIYDEPAAWHHRVRHRASFRSIPRARCRAQIRDPNLCGWMPQWLSRMWAWMRSRFYFGDPESHYYPDTAHLEAVWDQSSAEQW